MKLLLHGKPCVGFLADVGELIQVPDVTARSAYRLARTIVSPVEPWQPPTVYQCDKDKDGEVIAVFD